MNVEEKRLSDHLPAIVAVALASAVIPALGYGIYFRNEALGHLVQVRGHSLIEILGLRFGSTNFRPVIYALWVATERLFGPSMTAFWALNLMAQIGAMVAFYALVTRVAGASHALVAVVALQWGFPLLFYSLFNLVYGLFYPVLTGTLLAGLFFFVRAIESTSRRALALSLGLFCIAGFTHSFALILTPAVCWSYLLLKNPRSLPGNLVKYRAALVGTGVFPLLLPVVQSTEGQIPLNSVADGLQFASLRFHKLAELLFDFPSVFVVALAGGILTSVSLQHGPRAIRTGLASIVSVVLASTAFRDQLAPVALIVLNLVILSVMFSTPARRWICSFFIVAEGLFLVTNDMVAAYAQPAAIALTLLTASMAGEFRSRDAAGSGDWQINLSRWLPFAVGGIAIVGIFAGIYLESSHVPLRPVRAKLSQIERMRGLGTNMVEVLDYLKENQASNPDVRDLVFVAPVNRTAEIYTTSYVDNMTPSKFGYDNFLKLTGIEASVTYLDIFGGEALDGLGPSLLIALNGREVDEIETRFGLSAERVFDRGPARAAIFRIAPSQ